MAGEPQQAVVEKGLQALSAEPLSEWVDSQICWALECFAKAGMPSSQSLVAACLAEIVRRQAADGRWISEDGETRSAATTLGVLRVLKHYHL